MKMSFRYFSLSPFLSGVVEEQQQTAQRKNITLTLETELSETEVLGDKERLQQVMINLIDNAIKYTNPGGSVKISTAQQNNIVTINVSDTGVGIPKESLPRIFERFYRVDKERSRDAGGTGLGLAIVKHIVEAHGGKVTVQSIVGKGSTFSFQLKTL
jgi:two-component system phosphate regulon sensor histidine kinase PhoR